MNVSKVELGKHYISLVDYECFHKGDEVVAVYHGDSFTFFVKADEYDKSVDYRLSTENGADNVDCLASFEIAEMGEYKHENED